MDLHRKLLVEAQTADYELRPLRKIRENSLYKRLRRFRHTRIGRALTWPARAILRGPYKRLTSR